MPAALRQVGYDVTLLTEETLAHGSLAPYQAIVIGVRAFNVDARLPYLHERLMKYVADGGTLVVQYNTQNSHLGGDVADRAVAVQDHADARHRRDGGGDDARPGAPARDARQTRSATATSPAGCRSAGSTSPTTGTRRSRRSSPCTTPASRRARAASSSRSIGKGAFIYTGLAFFRQLPAGVPGAYRLFANLLDYAPLSR